MTLAAADVGFRMGYVGQEQSINGLDREPRAACRRHSLMSEGGISNSNTPLFNPQAR